MKVRILMMMKNKIKAFGMRVAAGTAALFIGMTPITAFANAPVCNCETRCTEDCIDEDCPVCKEDFNNCEGAVPEIVPEEDPVPEYGPLTPDGNMELVDDYGSLECGGKQFITVVSKTGHYFYIIIDRDDDGNENVHFLNMVDEADLLKLMEDDEVEKYMESISEKDQKKKEPVEEVIQEPAPEPEPEPVKKNYTALLVALPFMGVAAIAGYFALKKKKKAPVEEPDPDADYVDEEDDYLSQISEDDGSGEDE